VKNTLPAFKTGRAKDWTRERLDQLTREDIKQLEANALRLGELELAALCADVALSRPRAAGVRGAYAKSRSKLVPRRKAFETRGVWLRDERTSWSGVRKSDQTVVIALWAPAVQSADGGCACLLWAPNTDGARPWSDSEAGRERLEHCRIAVESARAEALLVHGEAMDGRLPEDRARSIHGVDPDTVIHHLRVEKRGAEFWAVWGRRTRASAAATAAPATAP